LTASVYVDDRDLEEEGIADIVMDDNSLASLPRPGTSLARPMTGSNRGAFNQGMRPVSSSGRPLTGFARPGTSSRPPTGQASVEGAMQGSRLGTARPMTSSGRFVRLGTASMLFDGSGEFINPEKMNMKKYATRPALARVLCEYLIYHDHNYKKALELASEASAVCSHKDWWWKAKIAKCFYGLGLYREAETYLRSSLRDGNFIITTLELCKVFLRLDQPKTALDIYKNSQEAFPNDISLMLGIARTQDALGQFAKALEAYRQILSVDASNVEAIASLAAHHFYSDQPELALRYYRRLLQTGVVNCEMFNNLGLCCYYAAQWDTCLSCFEKALQLCREDEALSDIWYNIGQIGLGLGDAAFAKQCFHVSLSANASHAESFCNLGVLEMRDLNYDKAKSLLKRAIGLSPFMHEPYFNLSLIYYKLGEFQDAFIYVEKALEVFPDHMESQELQTSLQEYFRMQ
jgi:tetratricopeptide repeat protein 8